MLFLSRAYYIRIAFLLLLVSVHEFSWGSTVEKSSEQINILFIYTDDQAPWAVGFSGNQQALTPNLDQLASQGMVFPNAYTTSPVCSPSRAGLLTSRYGYELGIDDWINVSAKSLTGNQADLGLDPQSLTWPKLLVQNGYRTGLVGKWHLGMKDKYHPSALGYQEFTGFRSGGAKPVNPQIEKNGVIEERKGFTADVLTDEAIDFIQRNQDKKFALSLHYRAPHAWWLPVADEDEAPYKKMEMKLPDPNYPDLNTEKAKRLMKEYLSSVRSIDRNVGRLLALLETLNLYNNTLVIFTSDHGYNMGHNGIWHKGNGLWLTNNPVSTSENVPASQRPNLYDNSIKVPLIVRWPGIIKANTKNLSTVSNLDWFPTLLEIANVSAPKDHLIRGKSFVPALLDADYLVSSDYYVAYTTLHQSLTQMRMYSDGQFKLIKDFKNPERDEFYDLSNDPDENTNLIDSQVPEHRRFIQDFGLIIKNKMRQTNDPIIKVQL